VQNPKQQRIYARALVQLYMSAGNVSVAFPIYTPTTTVAVPIHLAAGQSKRVTTDVVYTAKPGGCQYVEITALHPKKVE
jgi:hypothetical protein